MSVYVDASVEYAAEPAGYVGRQRARARWGHMIADTEEELHAMADRVGLRREWFQGDHYDLVPAKRTLAIRCGAVALKRRAFVEVLRRIRAEWAGAMTRPLLLALLLAGCASYPSDMSYSWDVDACLLRAQAIAEGAPRLVTYSELARVCRGEAP